MNKTKVDFKLKKLLGKWKIKSLRPVQLEAIKAGLFENNSLIVCAPSGSGKTLIGELAIALNNRGGMAIYLVPFKALADEKYKEFREKFTWFKVGISTGDYDVVPEELGNFDVLVATYERFDSILRASPRWLQRIKVVVIDEIHMISDPQRGSRLESSLVRLLKKIPNCQIIGLSATVANPDELAEWLNCRLVFSDTRPVPLEFNICIGKNKRILIREIVEKCLEDNGQALVFTLTRKEAERIAEFLSKFVENFLNKREKEELRKVAEEMVREDAPSISKKIADLISRGVGFHHAGLSHRDRMLLEELFREGKIKVIACTTTLSAGVNLPARYVILKDCAMRRRFFTESIIAELDANVLHQILGRAGRPGFDKIGYGIILTSSRNEATQVSKKYFLKENGELKPVYENLESCMNDFDALTEQVLLRIYEAGEATLDDIVEFFANTFWGWKLKDRKMLEKIFSSHSFDVDEFLESFAEKAKDIEVKIVDISGDRVEAKVRSEMLRGTWYNVVFDQDRGPYCSCPDFKFRKRRKEKFCKHLATLARFLLTEIGGEALSLIVKSVSRKHGDTILSPIFYLKSGGLILERRHRFKCSTFGKAAISLYIKPKTALYIKNSLPQLEDLSEENIVELAVKAKMIEDGEKISAGKVKGAVGALMSWIEERRESEICDAWKIDPGDFHLLRERTTWIMHCTKVLSNILGYREISEIAGELEERLEHGVKRELLPILRLKIPGIGRVRIRNLYNAGFKSPEDLRKANITILKKLPGIGDELAKKIVEFFASSKSR